MRNNWTTGFWFGVAMSLMMSIVVFLIVKFLVLSDARAEYQLEQVQVVFRHGDRILRKDEVYKTDPYIDVYESMGYGQLTKTGMQRVYKTGKMLKNRYNEFLGPYQVENVYAYSTDVDRTKMSLQVLLTGLFPPSPENMWNNDINWMPIPMHYNPIQTDFLYINLYNTCTRLLALIREAEKTPEILKQTEKYSDFLNYVRNNTQIDSATPYTIFLIYSNLYSVVNLGLPLPNWCSEECYQTIKEITRIFYSLVTHTKHLTRITAGLLSEQLFKNLNTTNSEKKIYLYSGHDVNIAAIVQSHEITTQVGNPDYASALIIEKLRGPDDQVYVQMFMWESIAEQLVSLNLKKCGARCTLSQYEDIVSQFLPDDEVRKCFDSNCPAPKHSY